MARESKTTRFLEYVSLSTQIGSLSLLFLLSVVYFMTPFSSKVDNHIYGADEVAAITCEDGDEICELLKREFPSHMNLAINGGQVCTPSRQVDLVLTADNSKEVIVGNTLQFTDGGWEEFPGTLSRSWNLSEGDGKKTVYAIFRSKSSDKSVIQYADIQLDETTGCGNIALAKSELPTSEATPEPVGEADVFSEQAALPVQQEEMVGETSVETQPASSVAPAEPVPVVESVSAPVQEEVVREEESVEDGCSSSFEFISFLSVGSASAEVRALQQLLQCLGDFPANVSPTAIFGPITEEAVSAFQTAHGIEGVGYVGPSTRAALNQY